MMFDPLFEEASELEICWIKSGKVEDLDEELAKDKIEYYESQKSCSYSNFGYLVKASFVSSDLDSIYNLKTHLIKNGYGLIEYQTSRTVGMLDTFLRGSVEFTMLKERFVDNELTQVYNRTINLLNNYVYLSNIDIMELT